MKISKIRYDYIDDENLQYINVWETDDENESGKTVAVVDLDTAKVIFFDNSYRMSSEVIEAIRNIKNEIYKYPIKTPIWIVAPIWILAPQSFGENILRKVYGKTYTIPELIREIKETENCTFYSVIQFMEALNEGKIDMDYNWVGTTTLKTKSPIDVNIILNSK